MVKTAAMHKRGATVMVKVVFIFGDCAAWPWEVLQSKRAHEVRVPIGQSLADLFVFQVGAVSGLGKTLAYDGMFFTFPGICMVRQRPLSNLRAM